MATTVVGLVLGVTTVVGLVLGAGRDAAFGRTEVGVGAVGSGATVVGDTGTVSGGTVGMVVAALRVPDEADPPVVNAP